MRDAKRSPKTDIQTDKFLEQLQTHTLKTTWDTLLTYLETFGSWVLLRIKKYRIADSIKLRQGDKMEWHLTKQSWRQERLKALSSVYIVYVLVVGCSSNSLASLRGRRSKGKGKGIRARDHARGRREKRAPHVLSCAEIPASHSPFNACHARYSLAKRFFFWSSLFLSETNNDSQQVTAASNYFSWSLHLAASNLN